MDLDIQTGLQTAFALAILGGILSLILGIQSIQSGQKLLFFRKRRELVMRGWRMIFSAALLGVLAVFLNIYAEPAVYQVFPPSPTITNTSTITSTPTISTTPTITMSPTMTLTLSITPTPMVPPAIEMKFEAKKTPNPDTVFSQIRFARRIDKNYQPIDPAIEFANPITKIYGTFSYDKMVIDSQWTAIWYRGNEIVFFETKPWDIGTGGVGYTDWEPPADQWLPGEYEVQIFNGTIFKRSARFIVTGNPPSPAPTNTPTRTLTSTRTPGPSPTSTPTITFTPTHTRLPTWTSTITQTPLPSITPPPLPRP